MTAAHNLAGEPHTIDVHRLKVPEAIRETEKATRDVLVEGGTTLRVITGRGNHSVGRIPVLKLALMRIMEGYVFFFLPFPPIFLLSFSLMLCFAPCE